MSSYYKFEVKQTAYVLVKADNVEEAWDIMGDAHKDNIAYDEIEWNYFEECDEDEADHGGYDIFEKREENSNG